jgi:AraC-like DNA-binding protein
VELFANIELMKAKFEQISPKPESSFTLLQLSQPQFALPYHFHSQFELTWIQKSFGKRYVGGNVANYAEGDLVLVGSNTPHCWLSENDTSDDSAQAIVVQFTIDFAGESFMKIPEMVEIKNLLQKATAGIQIIGKTRQQVIEKLSGCVTDKGFYKLVGLMETLYIIALSKETQPIDTQFTATNNSFSESERFQKVFQYLIENYRNEITLESVAEIAHLTPTAFCRFFKAATHKTLMEVITDFRINQACSLLSNTDKPILDVCFESGFGNISYFNKKFKAITGNTPKEYRKQFLK